MIDLDVLIPEDESVSFTGAKDGQKYVVKLYIPAAVAMLLIENRDQIIELLPAPGKQMNRLDLIKPQTVNLLLKIIAGIFKDQHPHMTEEWIKENVSLPRLVLIVFNAAKPVYEYLKTMGGMLE